MGSGLRSGRIEGAGRDLAMMTLLLYSYGTVNVLSRKIEAGCDVDIVYLVMTGNLVPDPTTTNRFRVRRGLGV
jgi:hypothetical protein